jgi:hypothetical protein
MAVVLSYAVLLFSQAPIVEVPFSSVLRFSHERGFYDKSFVLVLWSSETNAVIRYTLDGTLPSMENGLDYRLPLQVDKTSVIRGCLFADGQAISKPATHTFIFVDDVIRQGQVVSPGLGYPQKWGGSEADYGMDVAVVNDKAYAETIRDDLKSIPSFSIVLRAGDLFDASTGIYANASQDGRDWERPASIELIYPDGEAGFQIDAGIRIRGGYSRSGSNPKHGFRLFFRKEYGAGKLHYPLFGKQGASSFDGVDLRTFQNYSWSFGGDARGVFIRDQFSRDTQLALGHQGERGNYYHLYLNGLYWGLYNTSERPEASYGKTYFGGYKEDYDAIKVDSSSYTIMATDGDMDAWTRLYEAAQAGFADDESYLRIQGIVPDAYGKRVNLLDVDNLIDYMLVILYGGNLDAPISRFLGNERPNNWFGIRNRTGGDGFRFFIHDAEHTLLDVNEDRTGPYPAGDSSIAFSNPQWLWQKLSANAEFRLRVADRVQRAFFNGGPLSPEACLERFQKRTNEIYRAVTAESARWGDSKHSPALTRDDDWLASVNNIIGGYFPKRSGIVLGQLRKGGFYSAVPAPAFNYSAGVVPEGFPLFLSAPSGVICYTTDGSDPRVFGGSLSVGARVFRSAIAMTSNVVINARTLNGSSWSALNTAVFRISRTWTNLCATEIMYNAPGDAMLEGSEYEFIELKNTSDEEMDLGGISFSKGIQYAFAPGETLGAGEYVVLVKNPVALSLRYPDLKFKGPYAGGLPKNGEPLELIHACGAVIFSFQYKSQPPWPQSPAGVGFSLVAAEPEASGDPSDPRHWRASSKPGGSPGRADPPYLDGVVSINEVFARLGDGSEGFLELHNPNDRAVDIGGWYLTDDRAMPRKHRVPAPTIVPPGAFHVLTASGWDKDSTNVIELSPGGGQIYLFSARSDGELSGYCDGFAYGPSPAGASFGRHTNSLGRIQFVQTVTATPGRLNSAPRIGPVVLNQIHYRPQPGDDCYVELKNISEKRVSLFDPANPTHAWSLSGLGFTFPANTSLAPGETALVVSTVPEVFKTLHRLHRSMQVFGPYPGVLKPTGERLRLMQTEKITTDFTVFPARIAVDEVEFKNEAPWPYQPGASTAALVRVQPYALGDDPKNWRAGEGIPTDYRTLESELETDDFLGWERQFYSEAEMRDSHVSGALADTDADSMTNYGEYLSRTNPRDASSVLRVTARRRGLDIALSFASVEGKSYRVESSDSLNKGAWTLVRTMPGLLKGGLIEISEPLSGAASNRYYRVMIQP